MPSYKVTLMIPPTPKVSGKAVLREELFDWIWAQVPEIQGIYEGTVLAEEAHKLGLETESFVVDQALAPRERDWIASSGAEGCEIYFATEKHADRAAQIIRKNTNLEKILVIEVPDEDYMAKWKAEYKGIDVPPFWKIRPPWINLEQDEKARVNRAHAVSPESVFIKINPGAGFGTGTHETTQACMQILGEAWLKGFRPKTVLDFGSGSGILSIAAAVLTGANVDAVEIDPLAHDNARFNAGLSGVDSKIRFLPELSDASTEYDLIFANILRPILLEFCAELCRRLALGTRQGKMILSGLVDSDVTSVVKAYGDELSRLGHPPKVRVVERGEWRGIEVSV